MFALELNPRGSWTCPEQLLSCRQESGCVHWASQQGCSKGIGGTWDAQNSQRVWPGSSLPMARGAPVGGWDSRDGSVSQWGDQAVALALEMKFTNS